MERSHMIDIANKTTNEILMSLVEASNRQDEAIRFLAESQQMGEWQSVKKIVYTILDHHS